MPLASNDLQAFIVESEQILQDFTMQIHFRHRQFVNNLVQKIANDLPPAKQTKDEAASSVGPAAQVQAHGELLRFDLDEDVLDDRQELPAALLQVPNSRTLQQAANVAKSIPSKPAQTDNAFKETLAETVSVDQIGEPFISVASLPLPQTLQQAADVAVSTPSEPAQADKAFKEAMPESVASWLIPLQRDLKSMRTSMDRLEKRSASLFPSSDPSSFDLGHDPEQVLPFESLGKLTMNSVAMPTIDDMPKIDKTASYDQETPAAAAESIGLAHAKSNMNFAADMLGHTFSSDQIHKLHEEMLKCELPTPNQQDGCCNQSEPERRQGPLLRILRSTWFHRAIAFVIVLNAAFITYSTNYAVSHPEDPTSQFTSMVEVFFNVVYLIEITLRLTVHRLHFFVNRDFLWNNLDFFLVFGGFYDVIMTHVGPSRLERSAAFGLQNGFSVTFFRVLRLLRLAKVIRIFRIMIVFRELNVLTRVVMSTLRPLFWGSFVLATFFYMFAVVFTHGAASYLSQPDVQLQSEKAQQLLNKFGSVWLSMHSLYKATTGGADWGDVAEPLLQCGNIYYGLFLFFIAFVTFSLLNTLTGLFVERAIRGMAEDKDGMAVQKLHSDRAVVEDLCRIFVAMSGQAIEQDTRIGQEIFEDFMSSPVMRARLAVVDLEIWDAARFFKTLTSISQTSEINLATFVSGCMRLRGQANQVHLQALHEDLRSVKRHVKAAQRYQYELGRHILRGASFSQSFHDGSRSHTQDEINVGSKMEMTSSSL